MQTLSIFDSDSPKAEVLVDLEQAVLAMPQLDLASVTKHYFGGGMYARELYMPKGSVVTGKIHLKEHLCHISFGDVTIVEAGKRTRVRGPYTFVGEPGSKRALYMHENTLWTAFHVTDATTVEECEATLVSNDYKAYLELKGDK